jgi:hypothetical protein
MNNNSALWSVNSESTDSCLKIIVLILTFIFFISGLTGQAPVGSWTDHLVYTRAYSLAAGKKEVFASTGSSILVYNRDMQELRKLSPVNGLTETGISAIAWSEEHSTLVIGYTSANIDLVTGNSVYNIPDVERKNIPGEKSIHRIRMSGKYALLACSFGIVVVDVIKKEIYDTWKPVTESNPAVYDVATSGTEIWAATGSGVYQGSLTDPGLSYSGNWSLVSNLPDPSAKYTLVMHAGGKLYVNLSGHAGDAVYIAGSEGSLFPQGQGTTNTSFDTASDGFTITSNNSVSHFNTQGILIRSVSSYGWGLPAPNQAVAEGSSIWIADRNYGMVSATGTSGFTALTLPGPATNDAFNVISQNGKTIITGGGITSSWNNQSKPMKVSVNEENTWMHVTSETIVDPMRSVIDPKDNSHFFVSTWGGGVLEYRDGKLVRQYNDSNSPLQTIIPGQPYVRVCGLAIDDGSNLWITQTEVPGSIKVLKPDGTWAFDPNLTISAPTIGDITIGSNGFKWVVLPRGYGIFVLDDNGSPYNFSDDRTLKTPVKDSDNKTVYNVYSIASDLDGNIWAGTDQGPFIFYGPEKVFEDGYRAFRIKIPRNDGTNLADYMLGTETITSIAIDGANRKWLGTSGSGIYLLSDDGTIQLAHFNEDNSPLFSNNISSVAVDNKTGEVWIGTSKGIQSYRSNATGGGEKLSGVYAFPNPVRSDFTGNVTITGLIRGTQVKITDVSGNLVYETGSDGGMATWDLNNYRGERVATGVYIAFCSHPGSKKGAVTKILVIR